VQKEKQKRKENRKRSAKYRQGFGKLKNSFRFASKSSRFCKTETNRVEHHGGKMMRVFRPKEFNNSLINTPVF